MNPYFNYNNNYFDILILNCSLIKARLNLLTHLTHYICCVIYLFILFLSRFTF